MDVEYFSQLWDEKNKEENGRNGADSWDSRAEDFNVLDSDERVGKITNLLREKKMLRERKSKVKNSRRLGETSRSRWNVHVPRKWSPVKTM